MDKVSPFAPDGFPDLPPLAGVRLAAGAIGLHYRDRDDLMLVELAPETTVAGVFTRSATAAAPVDWCRKALPGGVVRALVVNSGNANAFTGAAGLEAVERTVEATADLFPCRPSTVFVASTGVIGGPLGAGKITDALPGLKAKLSPSAWEQAARAMMTTDTFAKGSTRTVDLGSGPVTINGIAKGSAMIAPNMATMLVFVFTDAAIPAPLLQDMLEHSVDPSFHSITVDGDTSTNDTVLLMATGGGDEGSGLGDRQAELFQAALNEVMLDLAHQVVRDGEGATKFVAVTVTGAVDDSQACLVGLSIANSPLVKTAIAGEDANWGRIVMAVGNAGVAVDKGLIGVRIGGHPVAENGGPVPGYDETPVALHMTGLEIDIAVDLGTGDGGATVWTCDLTHGYIDINADYRS